MSVPGHFPQKSQSERKIRLEYFAPQAQSVALAGTFNDWNPYKHPLHKDRGGKWHIEFWLEPGRYEYRFFVDGIWQNEQNPVECLPNPFGTWNCVLKVQK